MIERLGEARRAELQAAAQIVIDAGGEIVGRTKLQKTGYLLEAAGFATAFSFSYKYYGPFSEDLASAAEAAAAFRLLKEEQRHTERGVAYWVYEARGEPSADDARVSLCKAASAANAVELELAATAAFVKLKENNPAPWAGTAKLKPEKAADGRLAKAKALYAQLRAASENRLPEIGDD